MKDQVYKTKPANIEELKQRIIDELSLIIVDMLRNVRDSFQLKLAHYQAVAIQMSAIIIIKCSCVLPPYARTHAYGSVTLSLISQKVLNQEKFYCSVLKRPRCQLQKYQIKNKDLCLRS